MGFGFFRHGHDDPLESWLRRPDTGLTAASPSEPSKAPKGPGDGAGAAPGARSGLLTYALFAAAVGAGIALYAFGAIERVAGLDLGLLLTLVGGFPLLRHAFDDLLSGRLSSHLTIAIAAAVAVALGEHLAAAEVVFIVLVGEGLEHFAVDRFHRALAGFARAQPGRAIVRRGDQEFDIAAADVGLDDVVIVRAGTAVPVDGRVLRGEASVNQVAITGEPLPVRRAAGDAVYGGSISEDGRLEVQPERVGEDTTVARIGALVRDAQRRQAPIVRAADRLARWFLPVVVALSAVVYLLTGDWLRVASALIVACPCALVLATPAAMAVALTRLAREGVLVKGGAVLEHAAATSLVVFDKTGTLTDGLPALSRIVTQGRFAASDVLRLAASAELASDHLVGRCLVRTAERDGLALSSPDTWTVHAGQGVEAMVAGQRVLVGRREFVERHLADGSSLEPTPPGLHGDGSIVAVAVDDRPAALLVLDDPVRADAPQAIASLRALAIDRVVMITGDDPSPAHRVARDTGIDEVRAGLLPEAKAAEVRGLVASGAQVLMVGDGLNDAVALTEAHTGVAFGRGAAALSAQAADVIVLEPRLSSVPDLIAFSRRVVRRIRWSIAAFAFGLNLAAIWAAGAGWLSPAAAALFHQVASLAVIGAGVSLLFEGRALPGSTAAGAFVARGLARGRDASDRVQAWARRLTWPRVRRASAIVSSLVWRLALPAWLLTGITTVGPDQVGVVTRFGRLVEARLSPGLHVRLPWPVERVTRIEPGRLVRIEVGRRTPAPAGPGTGAVAWDTRHGGGTSAAPVESLVLTGDEQLVDVTAVVHLAIADPARHLFGVEAPQRLAAVAAERTLRTLAAESSVDALLTTRRVELEQRWREALQRELDALGTGYRVAAAELLDVHPPADVVEAFRAVASALEDEARAVNEAEGHQRQQVPLARGEAAARRVRASGEAASRVERSRGEAARFGARAEAARRAREVTEWRLYLEAVERVLADKRKFVTSGPTRGRLIVADDDVLGLMKMIVPEPGPGGKPGQ